MNLLLSAEQFVMPVQQIILLYRHPEMPSDFTKPWARTAYELEQQHTSMADNLDVVIRGNRIQCTLETGTVYWDGNLPGYWERFTHISWKDYECRRLLQDKGKMICNEKDELIANLIYHIARLRGGTSKGIKTIHHIYDGAGAYLYRHSVEEEIYPREKIETIIHDKLAAIKKAFNLADKKLPPCAEVEKGKNGIYCLLECQARLRCKQRKADLKAERKRIEEHNRLIDF